MSGQYTGCTISAQQMDELSDSNAFGDFQQTSQMAAMAKKHGADISFVGVQDPGGSIVAGAMITYTAGRMGTEGSVWLGPVCDPSNSELLAAVTDAIKQDGKRHHALSVSCWPNVLLQHYTSAGKADGPRNTAALRAFAQCGWILQPPAKGYDSVINHWVYVKDLVGIDSTDELLASFEKRTQWSVKRAHSMGVVVKEIDSSDALQLASFADIEKQTADRRNFEFRGEQYFKDFADSFGQRAHFYIAYIDTAAYEQAMQKKVDDLEQLVSSISAKLSQRETTKLRRRYSEESSNLEAARKRLESSHELRAEGDLLPAACSLFVTHPNETVYLFSGSVEDHKPFYASALIQYEAMIRLCLEKGVHRYNFYGIKNVFDDPSDEGYGVLEFKQGFNGHVEEMLGEFILPVNQFKFKAKQIMQKILSR